MTKRPFLIIVALCLTFALVATCSALPTIVPNTHTTQHSITSITSHPGALIMRDTTPAPAFGLYSLQTTGLLARAHLATYDHVGAYVNPYDVLDLKSTFSHRPRHLLPLKQ